jgi:hypothetical protein
MFQKPVKRGKKVKCSECGHTYREGEGHPKAKCQLLQVYKKTNKLHAEKTANGFPSKLEEAVYSTLLLRERAGEITDIRRQHALRFPCGPAWKIDFSFIDVATGERIYCEAKGAEMETYRIKKNMFAGCPVLESAGKLEVWKGEHKQPKLVETIYPKDKGGK